MTSCFATLILSLLAVATLPALAHGDLKQELADRAAFAQFNKMSLSHCADKMTADRIHEKAARRRVSLFQDIHKRRLEDRATNNPLDIDHSANNLGFSLKTPEPIILEEFSAVGRNGCVIAPESTEGPFYVEGEYVRPTLREDQTGVPLYIDLQVFDSSTCKPVTDIFVELWNCNATGVYGGIEFDWDPSNVRRTWLRGLQETKQDGSVSFSTIFPGHYEGRTSHVHVMTHVNATALPNGTVYDDMATHAGQFFFDQNLIDTIEALYPYNENKAPLLRNANDSFLLSEAYTSDPFFQWAWLDSEFKSVGLLAWIAFGINMTERREIHVAETLLARGAQPTGVVM
ncbi:Intradiol ring-cleavage dioxygenase [Diplogelasinospora grovesii]|uniref:Intradiol ring-cleavage dioxygenase n=1 Tax=Diplogelasinospora grovesii TaxID=303347 RepID=A0AAN6N6E4_9PEZI|nr:Intradiol ring-cleavage dioxygenase [Diplogelasinospora grovesii]